MRITVINGPNLNMLGIREKDIYGEKSYQDLCNRISIWSDELGVETEILQSNSEGAIIDMLQKAYFDRVDGLIINAGAYTHYSYAIRDAVAILRVPVVEVHLTDIYAREEFRHTSVLADVCTKQITGKGFEGYREALVFILQES